MILREREAAMTAERLLQPAVGGCAWCPNERWEGTLEETRAAALAHRLEHHPEAKPSRRVSRAGTLPHVSEKPLQENIANARAQGAASWDGATK